MRKKIDVNLELRLQEYEFGKSVKPASTIARLTAGGEIPQQFEHRKKVVVRVIKQFRH